MNTNILTLDKELPADQDPVKVYALSRPASQSTIRAGLLVIARVLGVDDPLRIRWDTMRFQHTSAIDARLQQSYSPASVRQFRSILRGVLRTAWKLGQMSRDDYALATDFGKLNGETVMRDRLPSIGELTALIKACQADTSPAGARDAAIIALLYACGLRRAELVSLKLSDYSGGMFIVTGKYSKQREVFIDNGARDAFEDWLTVRGTLDTDFVFVPINRGGRILSKPMHATHVFRMLDKRCEEAGVEHISPHDLRHAFISDLLDKGADINTVSKMAGHASVTTTGRYDRRPRETQRAASKLLHVPYRKAKS